MDRLYHDLKISPYRLKIPPPFHEKKGFILSWIDEHNNSYLADVSPLKGFSKQSYEELLALVLTKDFYHQKNLPPSLDFALHHPIKQQETIPRQKTAKLILSPDCLLKDLSCFSTLKIKTTLFETNLLIRLIKTLSKTFTIRLDANRQKLDLKLKNFLIEHPDLYAFIEEPLIEEEADLKLKIAIDETLYLEKEIPSSFIPHAIVYKPTLCGSIHRIDPFLQYAKTHQIPLIISSSFESEIGIAMLLKLMSTLNCQEDGGLDTFCTEHPFTHLSFKKPFYEFHPIL